MNKIKFSFNEPVRDLDGKPIGAEGQTMGKILAQTLMMASKGQVFKFYEWAQTMHNGQDLELDNTDYDTLYRFIEMCELPTITTYPLLMAMRKAKGL